MLDSIQQGFQNIVRKISGKSHISEANIKESIEEIKRSLLEADVNVRVVRRFVNKTAEQALGMEVLRSVNPGQFFVKVLHSTLCSFLGSSSAEIELHGMPASVLLCGLQGSGKTTSCAKLAQHYKREKKNVAIVALDYARPAAVEQLQQLGEKISVPVISMEMLGGGKVSTIVEFAKKVQFYATQQGYDLLLFDSAGRTELDAGLLDEIQRVNKILNCCARILVLDATTGQTAIQVAQSFHEALQITGLLLTKMDSDTRGGALLSVKTVIDVPVHFLGSGESTDALEIFHPERIASRILGMGDVVTLVEKVQEQVDQKDAEILERKIRKKSFTLQDYLAQMQQIKKMGSMEKLASLLPGVNQEQLDSMDLSQMKREEAILLSMTIKERESPKILGFSRRSRIAKGSGTTVANVNSVLKKFDKMKTMMKKALKNPKFQQSLLQKNG